jgi:hypothetical protein
VTISVNFFLRVIRTSMLTNTRGEIILYLNVVNIKHSEPTQNSRPWHVM